jgi:hypothetical protein
MASADEEKSTGIPPQMGKIGIELVTLARPMTITIEKLRGGRQTAVNQGATGGFEGTR